MSIGDVTPVEGDAGTVAVAFTVSLSSSNSRTVTVDYATGTGTATSGVDYQAASAGLTFSPGQTSHTLTILVNGDTMDEANETFFVNLFEPSRGHTLGRQAKATIADDDAPPTVSIGDVTIVEGNGGAKTAVLTLTLSGPSALTVRVNYQTADDTATTPGDYTAKIGTVTFAAGIVSRTITISVRGDLVDEVDERFFVNLTCLSECHDCRWSARESSRSWTTTRKTSLVGLRRRNKSRRGLCHFVVQFQQRPFWVAVSDPTGSAGRTRGYAERMRKSNDGPLGFKLT